MLLLQCAIGFKRFAGHGNPDFRKFLKESRSDPGCPEFADYLVVLVDMSFPEPVYFLDLHDIAFSSRQFADRRDAPASVSKPLDLDYEADR